MTVQVKAVKDGLESEIATFAFTVKAEEPAKPATPTVEPAAGKVEKGTVVTFSCETEGAEIMYSTDGGETWTKGDSFTVTRDVSIQVKAVKDGVDSEVAIFEFTVKAEEPARASRDPDCRTGTPTSSGGPVRSRRARSVSLS